MRDVVVTVPMGLWSLFPLHEIVQLIQDEPYEVEDDDEVWFDVIGIHSDSCVACWLGLSDTIGYQVPAV